MAEPFKNIYNTEFFLGFTYSLEQVLDGFDKKLFLKDIHSTDWLDLELKQRMRRISSVLADYLPNEYDAAVDCILALVEYLKQTKCKQQLEYMFLPDFIELYGLKNYNTSIYALGEITQLTSCEFAVRPFIIQYPQKMMKQMHLWSKHKSHDVRRLSTEGCRPRLPWAMALPALKENPALIWPILENLKNDSSEYVRKSVANNLNDIAKDNAQLVIHRVKQWQGVTKNTDWLIKHGCRTLLKQGNKEVMRLFGFGSVKNIRIKGFKIINPRVKIGEYLEFSFDIANNNKADSMLRLEYALYYQKANASLSKKVYKISEKVYPKETITSIHRKQSFKLISTRKFHLGHHQLAIVINGNEFNKIDFELMK